MWMFVFWEMTLSPSPEFALVCLSPFKGFFFIKLLFPLHLFLPPILSLFLSLWPCFMRDLLWKSSITGCPLRRDLNKVTFNVSVLYVSVPFVQAGTVVCCCPWVLMLVLDCSEVKYNALSHTLPLSQSQRYANSVCIILVYRRLFKSVIQSLNNIKSD